MSAKRTMLRRQLKDAGWKGSKSKRRARGLPPEVAARRVAVSIRAREIVAERRPDLVR